MTRTTLAALLPLGLGLCLTAMGCEQNVPVPLTFDLAMRYGFALPDLAPPLDLGMPPDLAPPVKPLIGTPLDRVGRSGVNLALTDPFNLVSGSSTAAVQDKYNTTQIAGWAAFAARPYLAENLAVFDGLDGICGNQILAPATLSANRYLVLANVLADDRLYIDSTRSVCTTYLAVEQGIAGDCGGNHPAMVTMDVNYNLFITGSRTATFTNGVTADADGAVAASAPFPFLQPPT